MTITLPSTYKLFRSSNGDNSRQNVRSTRNDQFYLFLLKMKTIEKLSKIVKCGYIKCLLSHLLLFAKIKNWKVYLVMWFLMWANGTLTCYDLCLCTFPDNDVCGRKWCKNNKMKKKVYFITIFFSISFLIWKNWWIVPFASVLMLNNNAKKRMKGRDCHFEFWKNNRLSDCWFGQKSFSLCDNKKNETQVCSRK